MVEPLGWWLLFGVKLHHLWYSPKWTQLVVSRHIELPVLCQMLGFLVHFQNGAGQNHLLALPHVREERDLVCSRILGQSRPVGRASSFEHMHENQRRQIHRLDHPDLRFTGSVFSGDKQNAREQQQIHYRSASSRRFGVQICNAHCCQVPQKAAS